MSRTTVRAAVANWFTTPAIPGVGTVFTSLPKTIQGSDSLSGVGALDGASLAVYIESEQEYRKAFAGATDGHKRIEYRVVLQVAFRSVKQLAQDAMTDFDTLIELLKVRLRSDRTLGGQVWQAGEGNGLGAPDITCRYQIPKVTGNGEIHQWAALTFTVIEDIHS
jgi:hypothetical protein